MPSPTPRSTSRPLAAAAALGLALALGGCGMGGAILDFAGPTSHVALDERAAAAAVSRYRARHGLPPVTLDSNLNKAASFSAAANAKAGRLSHDFGGPFKERMAAAGLAKTLAAENLSAGSNTFDQVLTRWTVSPGHNRNLLIPEIRRVGVARVDNPRSRYKSYWALVLAAE